MNVNFKQNFFVFLLPVVLSCQNDFDETVRFVELPPYHTVVLNGVFNVYLVQDSIYSIRILGNGNVPENISLQVDGDTLSISNESKRKWLNPETNKVKLYISSNQLSYIKANATCYFETINPIISNAFVLEMGGKTKLTEARLELDCNSFMYWNNYLCGGKITLSGRVNNLFIFSFALMSVDASNLSSVNAYIENNSKGDCQVFVHDRLEYSIRGSGNIYLKGSPKEIILNDKTSTGQLIHF